MSGFQKQLKDRSKELASLGSLIKRGMKLIENSCKNGWRKLKKIRS